MTVLAFLLFLLASVFLLVVGLRRLARVIRLARRIARLRGAR